MIELIEKSGMKLAEASKGSPVTTTVVVILFMFIFNLFEATIEKLIFGDHFTHWLDPFFTAGFIIYAAYAVYSCAVYNSTNK